MIPDTSWMVDAECNVRHPIADFWFTPANQKKEGHVQRAQRVAQALTAPERNPPCPADTPAPNLAPTAPTAATAKAHAGAHPARKATADT